MVANSTIVGNGTASGDIFAMRLDPDGGTVTMDVGPLSVFTSVSKQDPVPVLPNVQQTSVSKHDSVSFLSNLQ